MSFRKITVKSGDEEFTLEVTDEEYLKYCRPWWQQKKHEQRNREAMEQNGLYGRILRGMERERYADGAFCGEHGGTDRKADAAWCSAGCYAFDKAILSSLPEYMSDFRRIAWYSPSPLTMLFI